MEGGALVVNPETVIRVFALVVWAPVCALSYRHLIPRLDSRARWLASGLLLAQVALIVAALFNQPARYIEFWLWNLDGEYNIPSAFASTQLLLGACFALALCREARAAWRRWFMLLLALVFIAQACEEFFSTQQDLDATLWLALVVPAGAATAALTAWAAWRSPKEQRTWLLVLLAGLCVIGLGSLVIDNLGPTCGALGFLPLDGCVVWRAAPEEIVECLGRWLALLSLLGLLGEAKTRDSGRLWLLFAIAPLLWIPFIIHFSPIKSHDIPKPSLPASVVFEAGLQLHGFRLDEAGLPAFAYVHLPSELELEDYGYSAHLVDQASGASLASRDDFLRRDHWTWPGGRGYEPVYRQAIDLTLPTPKPVNRALWFVFSLWRKEQGYFKPLKALESDLPALNDAQIILSELALPAEPAPAWPATLARFDNGFALAPVALPATARAGETLQIRFSWRAEQAGSEDLVQFVHLGPLENGQWLPFDQQPLGPRLPTRFWQAGLADGETWSVPLPGELPRGRYQLFTGLYRAGDQQRIPARDAAGQPYLEGRAPLGEIVIEAYAR